MVICFLEKFLSPFFIAQVFLQAFSETGKIQIIFSSFLRLFKNTAGTLSIAKLFYKGFSKTNKVTTVLRRALSLLV